MAWQYRLLYHEGGSVRTKRTEIRFQETLDAGKVGKETVSTQQYVLLPLWSIDSNDPQNIDVDAAFDVKENESEVYVSQSSSDKTKKHVEKNKREAKGKSYVDLSTGVRNLSDEFEDFSSNSTNRVNAASAPVTAVGPNSTNNTNSFNAASPSNMSALEDIIYSDDEEDVDVEADFSNLETSITVSPIPTTRVYKDHHVTQIIGDLSSAPQTRSLTRMVKEQSGLTQQNDEDFHTYRKSASTPIDTEKPLLKDLDGEDVDVHIYRSMIGSLMYLTSSRLDIMFAVCACAPFQVTPKVSHLQAVKRIFRYLKGKPHFGLWYPKDSPFNVVAYSDSDYTGARFDRKSTTGGCQFLGCRLISWQCNKQTVVATSSTKVEYVAAARCCAQVLWIQNQLLDYGGHVVNV
nr:uncharacterized mitochondrial protein AtMg00810-like [Tanacetum cinerariifolium]